MSESLCPFLMIGMSEWPEKCRCRKERCAWWIAATATCVVPSLSVYVPEVEPEEGES